ncbi:MAG: cobalamin biosynthesis protein P47K [Oscillospiraceae bacterium]|nr:cobalamin biosynthesis protein P47K [Oscillospiraceae bacterium]
MKIIILGGFLGSGKTTVLLQLAEKLLAQSPASGGTDVMIIENEIGAVGVDDKVLKNQGLAVKELFAGCACCSSGGNLIQDIESIRTELNPQWVVIEATGVAYPRAIKERIEEIFDFQVRVLSLADASRWRRLWDAMPQMITAQIDCADTILLNKSDLITPELGEEISDEIKRLVPNVPLYLTDATKALPDEIWEKLL